MKNIRKIGMLADEPIRERTHPICPTENIATVATSCGCTNMNSTLLATIGHFTLFFNANFSKRPRHETTWNLIWASAKVYWPCEPSTVHKLGQRSFGKRWWTNFFFLFPIQNWILIFQWATLCMVFTLAYVAMFYNNLLITKYSFKKMQLKINILFNIYVFFLFLII